MIMKWSLLPFLTASKGPELVGIHPTNHGSTEGGTTMKITTLGIDLAKTVLHPVGLDEKGHEIMKKKVSRKDLAATVCNIRPCRTAMEACGSANFWVRKFLTMGHTVILIPPQYM